MNNANGQRKQRHIVRGLLAGAAGGLAASFFMNQFHAGLSKLAEKDLASRRVTPETEEENRFSGPVVHYAFGSALGALYGVAAECSPVVCMGFGTFFGSALFVGADGIAVPALGLSQTVKEQSAAPLLFHWLSHMVYGTTMELVRSGLRRVV